MSQNNSFEVSTPVNKPSTAYLDAMEQSILAKVAAAHEEAAVDDRESYPGQQALW